MHAASGVAPIAPVPEAEPVHDLKVGMDQITTSNDISRGAVPNKWEAECCQCCLEGPGQLP